jgi:predicted Zn finger-like uncharacterized protein
MLIVCPSCATSYDVELASLQPNGRRVRCLRCRTIWHAEPTQAEKLLAAAEALAPDPQAAQDAIVSFAGEPAPEPAVERAVQAPGEAEWLDQPADEQAADGGSLAAPPDGPDANSVAADDNSVPSDELGAAVEVEAPPIVPVDLDDGRPLVEIDADHLAEPSAEPPEDIETYAARHHKRRAKRRTLRWPLSNLQSGILALLIVNAILIGWRDDLVRILPQTASFYATIGLSVNLRGLVFDGITTTTEQHEGVPILVVEGNIVNASRKIVDVPRLKFAVRNAANEEIYSWTAVPPRASLPPGEAVSFRSRLASPPTEGRDVVVRFVTRRDIIAGKR